MRRVLIIGAGVIGTVYGSHLGVAGHAVSVLCHPPRTDDIAARGLAARDVLTGSRAPRYRSSRTRQPGATTWS